MRPENFEIRNRLLRRFILLYVVSIGLLIVGFRGLSSREAGAIAAPGAATAAPGATATANPDAASSATPGSAGNTPAVTTEKQRADQLMAELDSVRRQVLQLRREVLIKDSLVDQLAMSPEPDIYDHAFEKQALKQRQKEKAAIHDALQKIGHAE